MVKFGHGGQVGQVDQVDQVGQIGQIGQIIRAKKGDRAGSCHVPVLAQQGVMSMICHVLRLY